MYELFDLTLTAAVAAGRASVDKSYQVAEISKHLDFLNIMSYDLHGSWQPKTAHHSDMHQSRSEWEFSVYNTIDYWIEKGADPDKLVVGLASYGRTWTLSDSCETKLGAGTESIGGQPGAYTKERGLLAYYEICNREWNSRRCTKISSVFAPYGSSGKDFISYDDPESIALKIQNILFARKLKGFMFWSLEFDDFSNHCGTGTYPLLKAAKFAVQGISQEYPKCTSFRQTCSSSGSTVRVIEEPNITVVPNILTWPPVGSPDTNKPTGSITTKLPATTSEVIHPTTTKKSATPSRIPLTDPPIVILRRTTKPQNPTRIIPITETSIPRTTEPKVTTEATTPTPRKTTKPPTEAPKPITTTPEPTPTTLKPTTKKQVTAAPIPVTTTAKSTTTSPELTTEASTNPAKTTTETTTALPETTTEATTTPLITTTEATTTTTTTTPLPTLPPNHFSRVCYFSSKTKNRNGRGSFDINNYFQDDLCTHLIYKDGVIVNNGNTFELKVDDISGTVSPTFY